MVKYVITPNNYHDVMNDYRIKTEEEFIKEFGDGWQRKISKAGDYESDWEELNWVSPMNHLFGKPLREVVKEIVKNPYSSSTKYYLETNDGRWKITNAMITPNNDVKEFNKSIDKNTQKCFFKIIK